MHVILKSARGGSVAGESGRRRIVPTGLAICGFITCTLSSLGSNAESLPPGPAEQLTEVTVTAQRRTENSQNVPVAVTAFSAATLAQAGVTSVGDLGQLDSSLNIGYAAGVFLPFVRGIGNNAASTIGNESSVPVYIDDVYYTRLSAAYLQLNDIERVEVLKGPQGTLFGRNASGGAVQIFTRDPSETPEFEATLGAAKYNTSSANLYAATPLSSSVRWSIALAGLDQEDGWGKNSVTGRDTYKTRYITARSKLIWDAGSNTKVKFSFFYANQHGNQGFSSDRIDGTVGGTPGLYGPPQPLPSHADLGRFYDVSLSRDVTQNENGIGGAIRLDQGLDFADFVSITAYRRANSVGVYDGAFQTQDYLNYYLYGKDRQVSQELQLRSLAGRSISWIAGAYILDSKQGYAPGEITGDAVLGVPGSATSGATLDIHSDQAVRSYAGFGQATFPVAPETNFTLGLRYTKDLVRGVGTQTFTLPDEFSVPAQTPYDKTVGFSKLTYRLAIDHHFTERVMGYASVSRGFKSGTFDTLPLTGDPAKAEVVQAYELGVKSEFFERRLRFNAAIFESDIRNPQVLTQVTTGGVTGVSLTNAQKARVRGAEVESQVALGYGFEARAGATYLDAKYTEFDNAPFFYPYPGTPYGLQSPILSSGVGNTLSRSPSTRFDVGITYNAETSVGKFIADTNVGYTGEFAWDADNIVKQKAVALLNASLSFRPPVSQQITLRVWGKNLTGRRYYTDESEVAGGAGNISAPAPPLTFGIEVGVKY